MIKKGFLITFVLLTINTFSQQRVKIDGVAVVVGKNIVLDSDIEKFKKEVEQRSEGKIKISDCEMLEELMIQKLLSHHAVIDSIPVDSDRVKGEVDRKIASFQKQLGGTIEKVVEFYGFDSLEDLEDELSKITTDVFLVQGERASIIKDVDVTPDEVRTYFNNLKEDNSLPEFGAEIEISQIVIYAQPTDKEIQRVIDQLKKIKEDVENGSSMYMKAILYSDDPSVSSKGQGAGGFFSITRKSGFVKEFKEVAFSLDEGEVSEPFKTNFGYHIIKVEKIKGQTLDVRHIVMQPEIEESKLLEAKETLEKLKKEIEKGTISFEDAVKEYSEEKITKKNKGAIINNGQGGSGDSHFELIRMDPTLYPRITNLKAGELTEPYYDETREGEKMFKIMLLKSKTDTHIADYIKDYVKIQQLALQKKQDETIEKWSVEKIADTYIKINKSHKKCTFDRNWKKE